MLSRALRLTGNLLIAGSVLGLVALAWAMLTPEQPKVATGQNSAATNTSRTSVTSTSGVTSSATNASVTTDTSIGGTPAQAGGFRPITRIVVPAIALAAEVVPSGLVPRDGGVTWEVPAFKVGHAETTAGAGQVGNAVLLGHVTSLRSGNVFQDLDRMHIGDAIQVFSDADEFEYRVVETSHIPRSDSSVLDQGQTPAVSLITCTGVWLPTIWDYTERLVVRAELYPYSSPSASPDPSSSQ